MSLKKFSQFINEAAKPEKKTEGKDAFQDFAEKRGMGAKKIADNAKERGGLAMLTYNHFKVKLPFYDKAAKAKITYDEIVSEYDKRVNDLVKGKFSQTEFQKLVGEIEVLGELKLQYEKINGKALNEGLAEKDEYIYEIKCRDGEGTLKEILECIKACGNVGHTFDVVVDPDEKEGLSERKFNWDGDGADYISEINVVKEPGKNVNENNRLKPEDFNRLKDLGLLDPDFFAPEAKDIQRAQDLQAKPIHKRDGAAESMAKLITDPQKLIRRSQAIAKFAPHHFWPFADQLKRLGFSEEQISRVRNYTGQ